MPITNSQNTIIIMMPITMAMIPMHPRLPSMWTTMAMLPPVQLAPTPISIPIPIIVIVIAILLTITILLIVVIIIIIIIVDRDIQIHNY